MGLPPTRPMLQPAAAPLRKQLDLEAALPTFLEALPQALPPVLERIPFTAFRPLLPLAKLLQAPRRSPLPDRNPCCIRSTPRVLG
jgi:hypothetical protein